MRYPCHEGYQVGRLRVRCHSHASPLDLRFAVATSCNAYFCYVFRNILENPKYGSVKDGFDVWRDYVLSFGFGRKLDSDFLGEGNGYVPDRDFYDRVYRKSWNSLTVLSLAIGQGELGLHSAADGQPGGDHRQPGLLLHSAYRPLGRRTGFARPPLL